MNPGSQTDISDDSQVIGYSEIGRAIAVRNFGRADSPLRVMIVAGQHGDERYSRRAARRLMDSMDPATGGASPPMFVSVLADANPDGSSAGIRENRLGLDLNRDHLRLESRETRAIHAYVRQFRPQVIIDAHNYPSRRKHLLDNDMVIDADVFMDAPTLPEEILPDHLPDLGRSLVESVRADLARLGFTFERYLLFKPSGQVRTSSLGLLDARNSLSARYGALGVILEGRAPTKKDGAAERQRLLEAQFQALRSILGWALTNASSLTARPGQELPDQVPIRWKYETSDAGFRVPFQSNQTGGRFIVSLTGCQSEVRTTLKVPLPLGYAIPNDNQEVMEILSRHGYRGQRMALPAHCVLRPQPAPWGHVRHGKGASGVTRSGAEVDFHGRDTLRDYVYFPAGNDGGLFLALLLEFKSRYGLWHHGTDEPAPCHCGEHPILAVLPGTDIHARAERGRHPYDCPDINGIPAQADFRRT